MSSTIFYKFKSAKEFDRYSFEGTSIPVWELKIAIIAAKKLPPRDDYDLVISNAQTEQDYTDENQIVPRNSSVLVRRVPMSAAARSAMKRQQAASTGSIPSLHSHASTPLYNSQSSRASSAEKLPATAGDEEVRIAAMMKESDSHWELNQDMPSQ